MDFLGGLIGAGASIFNGIENRNAARDLNNQNIQNQLNMAQNRIQWTVADAKAAGINPLAALGNATQSYSNVAGDTGLGDSVAKAGHELGRAVAAQSPTALRNAELENKLLEAKIANMNADTVSTMKHVSDMAVKLGQPGTPPGTVPVYGGGSVPLPRVNMSRPGAADAFYAKPLTQDFITNTGDFITAPSADASTATQTLMAAPASAVGAVQLSRDNLDNFARFMTSGSRGDSWRASDSSQLQFLGQ